MKKKVRQTAQDCVQLLREIDFEHLGLSPYNLEYIQRLLPELEYHFRIYTDAINIIFYKEELKGWVVDFGGGPGFLSLLLKKLGLKVIYCDQDPLSIRTISILSEKLGLAPDHIVEGTSNELQAFCSVNKLKPARLIATDVIEHIYDLNAFFANLYQINPAFQMILTTRSNPCNPWRVKKLRNIMTTVENQFFFPMRKEYIQKNFSEISENETETLAKQTRGLTYKDMDDAIDLYLENGTYPEESNDPYNTCDPATGSWMERILPLKTYREILKKNSFRVTFKKGYYNEKRKSVFFAFTIKQLNRFIKYSGSFGRIPAAYLILKVKNAR